MPFSDQRFVLVVDDEAIVRETFLRAFSGQRNFLIDAVESVEEGIKRIKAVQYDLAFIDMKFEGQSYAGMRLLEELRAQQIKMEADGALFHPTKVIIMSGSICLNDISVDAHDLLVFSFVDKKVGMDEEFVRKAVNYFGLPLLPRRRRADRPEFPP